jgi:hypothetical protein
MERMTKMIAKPPEPGGQPLAWPFIRRFTERVLAEDRIAVEDEQVPGTTKARDCNHEVFPEVLDVRDMLRSNRIPIRPDRPCAAPSRFERAANNTERSARAEELIRLQATAARIVCVYMTAAALDMLRDACTAGPACPPGPNGTARPRHMPRSSACWGKSPMTGLPERREPRRRPSATS